MPKIDDVELRGLFKIESAEHLQKLDAGLLQLEKMPGDKALLQEVFREAHSLKGSARMLGLIDIQTLANSVEDMLGDARSGKAIITADVVKLQLATLDQIREMVAEAVGDSVAALQPEVMAEKPIIMASAQVASKEVIPEIIHPAESLNKGSQIPSDFHIDTLRVDARKLDFLLNQTSELVVTKSRIVRWQKEFHQLINDIQAGRPMTEDWAEEARSMDVKLAEDANRLGNIAQEVEGGIRGLRLLPVSTLLEQFPRMVHDLAAEEKKLVDLIFEGEGTVADKRIIEEMKAPLMHMLRNAIDHGIETPELRRQASKPEVGRILVKVSQNSDHVRIDVIDDGRGLDLEGIRQQAIKRHLYTDEQAAVLDDAQLKNILMTPGFSTNKMITDISGRGVGLDVVRTAVERMHGTLGVDSKPGQGMTFTLNLPVSLSSTRVMILREWGEYYALPCEAIEFAKILMPGELILREDRQCFYHNDVVIDVSRLGSLLDRPIMPVAHNAPLACIVIKVSDYSFGLIVDALQEEEEIVLKAPPTPIKRMRNISGVTILDSGFVCPVLNASDLEKSVRHSHLKLQPGSDVEVQVESTKKKSLLLVEDSIVTRIQEKRILEAAGYEVVTAIDGVNAWNVLSGRSFSAIVSDIMMPNMDGLELTRKIRENKKYSETPIILVTSLSSDEDRRKGLDAGADAYITKSEFDQAVLLDAIARLI